MAQELLTTFSADISEVALRPGKSGQFRIDVDETIVWDRETDQGFPDISTLKQRVRDIVSPDRSLGHVDRKIQ
ncbi:hypothetical protein GCM10011410_16430 [Hoyosella rhizosphaerae]|uniref:SelT/SelW/SelH family protein n=2 Tax=Hoyosella rhizosphaerae TaxID=1755582 RepID=A0A916XDX3_9ACTN|nr:hypothetical protein GCM10011410_16430 [Hoyosella rhizosphaerae]